MVYENVVIGKPICEEIFLFANSLDDWNFNECGKTLFTQERFLPKILVDCGVAKNTSEVRRNKPEFVRSLDKLDFEEVKWGKKRIYICVGE